MQCSCSLNVLAPLLGNNILLMVVLAAVEWHGDSSGADKLVGVQTLQLSSEETADPGHWYFSMDNFIHIFFFYVLTDFKLN